MTGTGILHVLAPIGVGLVRRAGVAVIASCITVGGWAGEWTGVVQETTRLSAWLPPHLNQWSWDQGSAGAGYREPYLTGLLWSVPDEVPAQQRQRSSLLASLRDVALSPGVEAEAVMSLARWLEGLPVTGRVRLPNGDPRWLEVHPEKDPLLRPGQRLTLKERPASVTLVWGDGRLCQVRHQPGVAARDYLRACDASSRVDSVWVVQPDGIAQQLGIALWNEERQEPPAPGAWVVVQDDRIPWHGSIYEQLARFLATQGPAPDGEPAAMRQLASDVAATQSARPLGHDLAVTASDWGNAGLLQMPTARMYPAGLGQASMSDTKPYRRFNFNLQPFDWLETSFRYVDVTNRSYLSSKTGQSYKDKSIDLKLKLASESRWWPQMAVGIRDLAGTGQFSGEYIAASKRLGNFDWTVGLGWGYLGARGDLKNPLSWIFGSGFDTRPKSSDTGQFNLNSYFHGPAALFGGVQYQTPWEPLLLKLEYDGNDYQHEPQKNNQRQRYPVNFGAVYRYSDNLDLTLAWERGTTASIGLSLHASLDKLMVSKVNDPKPVPVSPYYPLTTPDWKATAKALEDTTRWRVEEIRRAGSELLVRFGLVDAYYWNDYLERIAAILHRDAPEGVLVFRVQTGERGLDISEFLIDRRTWVDARTRLSHPRERRPAVYSDVHAGGFVNPFEETLYQESPKRFTNELGPYYQHTLGGPDGFVLYQLGAQASAKWWMRPDTWLAGSLRARVLDNYDNFTYTAPSNLPRVRTYLREFLTTSEVTLPTLQLTHVGRLGRDQYYSVYGGILESMYAGVGGEWLYRPWNSRVAFGVDINAVKQRGFAQDFSFRDYSVATGHATLYWDTGIQDILATVSAGRYLAGDIGITLDLAKVFPNGVQMGAWATKTNVSAKEFGEGSFDKGIYLRVPFDAMLSFSTGTVANLIWNPLTRDGGAKLGRMVKLEELTRVARGDVLRRSPRRSGFPHEFGEVLDAYPDRPIKVAALDAAVEDLSVLGEGVRHGELWRGIAYAGALTAASSLLDDGADRLARQHGNSKPMQGLEKVGSYLPFAAMGFSGLMALTDGDATRAKASFASLEAGGVGALTALGLKYAFGRARPGGKHGNGEFTPFSWDNGDSALPSMHATVAWAALTPYAKAYDAPWLYAVAGLTNVARISERKHWLSDTVAGAFVGYGLGSLFWESRKRDKLSPSVYLGPGEVGLEWVTP